MYRIVKRDGKVVDFDVKKISSAITKAFIAVDREYHPSIIDMLALRTCADFEPKIVDGKITVEDVQDSVEKVLSDAHYADVAKAYILYRKQREKARNLSATILDYKDLVNSYVDSFDWHDDDNSSMTYSIGGLILSNSGAITNNYWLSEVYDEEIAGAHKNGDIHIHDLNMLSGHSAGWSIGQLIKEGLGGVDGKITSAPAKHLSTLCNQMVNFLGIMQNEWAGAQSFSSFDTYLAPFVKEDKLTYKQVKQCIQSFVYGVNTPSRWGTQSPFSNITIDWTVPDDLKDQYCIVGGKTLDYKYKNCQKEMNMINKAFIETMLEGETSGRSFQYPIPTYSITKEFKWEENENNELLFSMASKYGIPYFGNYINSDLEVSDIRNNNFDLKKLNKKTGGYFGYGELTGSIGEVTINMPRLAYLSSSIDDFYKRLDRIMDISVRSLNVKREVLNKLLESGLYPYTKRYLKTFKNHFSTVGIVGMNEMCLNAKWLNKDLTNTEAQDFSKEVLKHMSDKLLEYQKKSKTLFNLEATPAELTAYSLAKKDKETYKGIITANNKSDVPYYTNSSQLPVGYTDDILKALDIQDELQVLYTAGTTFHIYLGEKINDWRAVSNLVNKISSNYHLPYFTLSPTYSICAKHGYLTGEIYKCPKCGKETEVWSRITGYYRPLHDWNPGKVQEFKDRKEYVSKDSVLKASDIKNK